MKLILSAIPSELESITQAVGATKTGDVYEKGNIIFAPAGVGFVAAYQGLHQLLELYPTIREVFFVGTAGVYASNSTLQIGDYVVVNSAILADGAAEMGLSKYASFMANREITATRVLEVELPSAKVACLLTLTLSSELALQIPKNTGAECENMELYAIALKATEKNLPWGGLLGITNEVGPEGHQQWVENRYKIEGYSFEFLGRYCS